jgi:hypothetical protein
MMGETGNISKLFRIYLNYIPGSTTSRKYRKQPYQAQCKYLEK